jgi:hypothetical protein
VSLSLAFSSKNSRGRVRHGRPRSRDYHGRINGRIKTMANQLGKRYLCDKCGTEVLCNKPGTGAIECCDAEMKIKEAKALPSSD